MPAHLLAELLQHYDKGKTILSFTKIDRSFLHPVWHCETEMGHYLLKQFTVTELPIVARATANACWAKQQGIATRTPLISDQGFWVCHHDSIYQLYPWISGKIYATNAIEVQHASKIGDILAQIHHLNVAQSQEKPLQHYSQDAWQSLFQQLEEKNFYDYCDLKHATQAIIEFNNLCENSLKTLSLQPRFLLSHGDLIPQNVIWQDEQNLCLIDWDLSGMVHRDLELLGVALNWSGIVTGTIDKARFLAVCKAYRRHNPQATDFSSQLLCAGLGSWLAWLYDNLCRFEPDMPKALLAKIITETKETVLALMALRDNMDRIQQWQREL